MNQTSLQDLRWSIEDEISQYVDEFIYPKLEGLIEEKLIEIQNDRDSLIDEIKEEIVYEMYKMKKELEDQIHIQTKYPKKSFWKWWQ